MSDKVHTLHTPARGRGRYTPEQVIKAIHAAEGIMSDAARILGCARRTVYNYRAKYPEVEEAAQDATERVVDIAEAALAAVLRDAEHKDHVKVACYILDHKGTARGYGRKRIEVSGPGGGAVQLTAIDPTKLSRSALAELEALSKAQAKEIES